MAARGGEESVFLRDVAPDGLSHTPVANLDPCAHAQHDLDSVSSKRVLGVGSEAWWGDVLGGAGRKEVGDKFYENTVFTYEILKEPIKYTYKIMGMILFIWNIICVCRNLN